MKGTIKRYIADRGFGFIKPLDGVGPDIFFHIKGCATGFDPEAADRETVVDAEVTQDDRGLLRAINVRPIGDGPARYGQSFDTL